MTETQRLIRIISDLLDLYPARAEADREKVLAGYAAAVRDVPLPFVAGAARRFNAGMIGGHNNSFAPSPAQLGAEARRLWEAELAIEARDRAARRQIAARADDRREEDAGRRKAVVAEAMARLALPAPDCGASRLIDLSPEEALLGLDAKAAARDRQSGFEVSDGLRANLVAHGLVGADAAGRTRNSGGRA